MYTFCHIVIPPSTPVQILSYQRTKFLEIWEVFWAEKSCEEREREREALMTLQYKYQRKAYGILIVLVSSIFPILKRLLQLFNPPTNKSCNTHL